MMQPEDELCGLFQSLKDLRLLVHALASYNEKVKTAFR
jgi:hypothetical protein